MTNISLAMANFGKFMFRIQNPDTQSDDGIYIFSQFDVD